MSLPERAAALDVVVPTRAHFDDRLMIACGLAWGAGLLYGLVALAILGAHPLAGAVAIALAIALIGWSPALYRTPTRVLRIGGVLLGVAVLALWAGGDLAGSVTGPSSGSAAAIFYCPLFPGGVPLSAARLTSPAIGALVSLANADTLALIALLAFTLGAPRRRLPRIGGRLAGCAGAFLVLVSCVSLGAVGSGGHVH